MTIDEAIAMLKFNNKHIADLKNDDLQQLAEWLEDYRRLLEFEKSVLANEDGYLATMCERIGYNKAVDDLLEDANEMAIEVDVDTYTMKAIGIGLLENIAEQLKVGGKNERSI